MPRVCRLLAAAMSVAGFAGIARAAPLAAYGKLPSIEQAVISPDGARLALAVTNGDQRAIAIETLADRKLAGGLKAGDDKVRDLRWAGPDHLLVTISQASYALGVLAPKSEWQMVVDYDVAHRRERQLLSDVDSNDGMSVVTGPPSVRMLDGRPHVLVAGVQFIGGDGVISLYEVNLDTDRSLVRAQGDTYTTDWLVDAAGAPLAETEYDGGQGLWTLKISHGGFFRVAKTLRANIDPPQLLGLGADDRSVLVSASKGGDAAVRVLDPAATDWSEPTLAQQDLGLILDPVTEALIGTHALVGDDERYRFFTPGDQAIWDATVKAFPGQRVMLASDYVDPDDAVTLASMSKDHRKLVVVADSPTEGPAYFVVDIDKGRAAFIGNVYQDLRPADVSPSRPVAFKAADGLALTGYLTTPRGRPPKDLPLIVFPHGGPAARDAPGFDWWVQAMASRGYAVLQVNYRGSDGFGWDFLKAGFGQWGRKMQTDLSDGVRYLAAQGVIDPKRVCIVGASYGGYAALAGATLDPGVYRCAVDVSGISDVGRFIAWAQGRNGAEVGRYWMRYMGADGPRDPRLADISPIDHVDKVSIPILIIHGKDDTVVPFEQSRMMVDALKRAGKPVQLVVLDHEDHRLSRGATRLQMLQATMDFLEAHDPAQ